MGFLLSRYWGWSQRFFQGLSRFLVKIALPLYFFTRISATNLKDIRTGLLFPFAAVGIIFSALLIAWGLFLSFPIKKQEKRACMALSCFGNSAIIPLMMIEIFPVTLPLIAERFGTLTPTLYVGIYVLVQNPLLWTLGNFLVSGKGKKPALKELITPPLIGILAGLLVVITGLKSILFQEQLPFYHVYGALYRLGQGAYPMILLCLGSMIANIKAKEGRKILLKQALTVSSVRFLIMPMLFLCIYFLLLRRLELSQAQIWMLFLEFHVPPATNLSIMASRRPNESLVSFTILLTYAGYLIILPVFLLIFLSLPGIL